MNDLDKNVIAQEIEQLKNETNDQSKHLYSIAKSKIDALNSLFYEKV